MFAYMQPESEALNVVFLHNLQEIKHVLGPKWARMKTIAIVQKLIRCLY